MSTVAEIRARASLAFPGPWQWAGNTKNGNTYLAAWVKDWGRCSIMDFRRDGMQGAEPRFMDDEVMMHRGRDIAIFEVCPDALTADDPRVYRTDIVGFRDPNADFIAHSRQDVDDLLAEIDRLNAIIGDYEKAAS